MFTPKIESVWLAFLNRSYRGHRLSVSAAAQGKDLVAKLQESIFGEGIKSAGNNPSISDHIEGRKGDSAYISVAASAIHAKGFAVPYGYLMEMNIPEIYAPIPKLGKVGAEVVVADNKEGGIESFSDVENEQAALWKIKPEDIRSLTFTAGIPGVASLQFGKPVLNPQYQPRIVSVELLSADPAEAKLYAPALLPKEWEPITNEEAIKVMEWARQQEVKEGISPFSIGLIIDGKPKGMSFDNFMDKLVEPLYKGLKSFKGEKAFVPLSISDQEYLKRLTEKDKVIEQIPKDYPVVSPGEAKPAKKTP